MAVIIDGKAVAARIRKETADLVAYYTKKSGKGVTLAVVRVGDDPASEVYVRNKIRASKEVGIESIAVILPQETTQEELETRIKALATDNAVDGILVQLPLPKGLNEEAALSCIPPEKDVDGFHPVNVGKLTLFQEAIVACTPAGIMELLKTTGVEISGKNAVVVGRSNIVGKPVALLLLQQNATVTVCHSRTKNLEEVCKNADILVVAIGKPRFITENMVKEGAVVIDVGINRTENGLVGDVDFAEVAKKAGYITPVPGGVGPMTVAMLLNNTCIAAARRNNIKL